MVIKVENIIQELNIIKELDNKNNNTIKQQQKKILLNNNKEKNNLNIKTFSN